MDLIEAGTSLATAGLVDALVEDDEVDEPLELEPDEELVLELLLLLPQAATAPRHKTSVGTTIQLLQLRISSPPVCDGNSVATLIGRQDMRDLLVVGCR